MPLQVSRLRRWFAAGAIAAVLVVAASYFYARHRVLDALKQVPGKINLDIQQSANGFSISRSEQGRTLFKVQASKAIQFKTGGRAELHDVTVTLYGRDSTRFDQIYGADFLYDQKSGDVIAQGPVQIDLENNPEGLASADQQAPKEFKNPIHLKTSGLVFNQKTGNAYTRDAVTFSTAQITGSAVGVSYSSASNQMVLESAIKADMGGPRPIHFTASHGVIAKQPRQIVFEHATVEGQDQTAEARQATVVLRDDNTLQRIVAKGDVRIAVRQPQPMSVNSGELELTFADRADAVQTAIFYGGVDAIRPGPDAARAHAVMATVKFGPQNRLETIHASEQVKLAQMQRSSGNSAAQNVEVASDAMDLLLGGTGHLTHAETAGPAQIAIVPVSGTAQRTTITAGKFTAGFDQAGQLALLHGAPSARIVSSTPGKPDRITSSDLVEAHFQPGHGVSSLVQEGNFSYAEGERRAWAERARYTVADQELTLTGSPRVSEGAMNTTADTMRLERANGTAVAEGNVKSTYAEVKSDPNGGWLGASSPIHVTAKTMTATNSPALATYTGDARLWQDANVVAAPTLVFDRNRRSLTAHSTPSHLVSVVLVQSGANGKITPLTITASQLSYSDAERLAIFSGGVVAKAQDGTLTAKRADIFLKARGATSPQAGPTQLDRIVAEGDVVLVQPARRATGEKLTYTAADGKYVLSGGPPSIFDAERGHITGVSLTFFSRDDRVLVEGSENAPTVTHTRVAR